MLIDLLKQAQINKKEIVMCEQRNENFEEEEIAEKIKELLKKGNISRILVKKGGETIFNLPINAGIVAGIIGAVAAPWAMLTATIAATGPDCRIELVKVDGSVIDISGETIKKEATDADFIKEDKKQK